MKIKNIAFSGVAAAIFGMSAAHAAPVEIASRAYVDNVRDATLQTVSNTYITSEDAANTYVNNTQLGDQITNNITNALQDADSAIAKELATKADASDVNTLRTDVNGLKTAVGDETSGLTKATADAAATAAAADKKASDAAAQATKNATDLTALDVRVTKNTNDIAAINSGIDKTVADAIAGALTGEGEIKESIDAAIDSAIGDLPIGTLTTDVANLKTTVGDDTTGLVKDVADNSAAIETLNGDENTAGSVANTVKSLAVPQPTGDCAAQSGRCVLSYDTTAKGVVWMDVTSPLGE